MSQSSANIVANLQVLVVGRPHAEQRYRGVDLNAVLEVLVAAAAEIDAPERWCKGSPAVLRSGAAVRDLDDLAIYPRDWLERKCAEGAIHYAAFWQGHPTRVALQAVQLLEGYVRDSLYSWNDDPLRLHAEVIGLLRTAIRDLAHEAAAA